MYFCSFSFFFPFSSLLLLCFPQEVCRRGKLLLGWVHREVDFKIGLNVAAEGKLGKKLRRPGELWAHDAVEPRAERGGEAWVEVLQAAIWSKHRLGRHWRIPFPRNRSALVTLLPSVVGRQMCRWILGTKVGPVSIILPIIRAVPDAFLWQTHFLSFAFMKTLYSSLTFG